jgi:hypothetical protein
MDCESRRARSPARIADIAAGVRQFAIRYGSALEFDVRERRTADRRTARRIGL